MSSNISKSLLKTLGLLGFVFLMWCSILSRGQRSSHISEASDALRARYNFKLEDSHVLASAIRVCLITGDREKKITSVAEKLIHKLFPKEPIPVAAFNIFPIVAFNFEPRRDGAVSRLPIRSRTRLLPDTGFSTQIGSRYVFQLSLFDKLNSNELSFSIHDKTLFTKEEFKSTRPLPVFVATAIENPKDENDKTPPPYFTEISVDLSQSGAEPIAFLSANGELSPAVIYPEDYAQCLEGQLTRNGVPWIKANESATGASAKVVE